MTKNRFIFSFLLAFVFLFFSFGKNNTITVPKNEFVVVLDAGHGGHDPGNLGNGFLEKDIALKIVLQIGKALKEYEDIRVIYTRDDDTFVDLFKRGEIANQANADLFVSVHCDSHASNAYGAGTFVLGLHANKQNFEVAKKENSVIYLEDNYEQKYAEYDINSPESIIGLTIMQEEFLDQSVELAKLLQKNFTVKLNRKDRKVKQAGFIVLHQTFMPSVLIETGFLTNMNEGTYLNSQKGQKEMGQAIANAILSYKKNVGSNANAGNATTINDMPVVKEAVKETEVTTTEKPKNKKVVAVVESQSAQKKVVSVKEKPKEPEIVFKVQLMASGKVITLDSGNFRGLAELSKEAYKNLYRYMYGHTNSYQKAKLLKSKADAKGYIGSYIVAYKAGKRIPLKEALNQ